LRRYFSNKQQKTITYQTKNQPFSLLKTTKIFVFSTFELKIGMKVQSKGGPENKIYFSSISHQKLSFKNRKERSQYMFS
jgi:hypothetical protein